MFFLGLICIIVKDYKLILRMYGWHDWHVSETGRGSGVGPCMGFTKAPNVKVKHIMG